VQRRERCQALDFAFRAVIEQTRLEKFFTAVHHAVGHECNVSETVIPEKLPHVFRRIPVVRLAVLRSQKLHSFFRRGGVGRETDGGTPCIDCEYRNGFRHAHSLSLI
jgi:hypothetical protein